MSYVWWQEMSYLLYKHKHIDDSGSLLDVGIICSKFRNVLQLIFIVLRFCMQEWHMSLSAIEVTWAFPLRLSTDC
jgi:hypothetical protein